MPENGWVEIPDDTMKKLREDSVQLSSALPSWRKDFPQGPRFEGYPVRFEDGKWYVEIRRLRGNDSPMIQEIIEHQGPGTFIPDPAKNGIHVWDGDAWIWVTGEELIELGMGSDFDLEASPWLTAQERVEWKTRNFGRVYGMGVGGIAGVTKTPNLLTPEQMETLEGHFQERQRLALRQQLEAQQQEDE